MRSHQRLDVRLTLLGPILTRGGHMAAPGVDAAVARDALRRPMLPYSLVKGKVRDALSDLGHSQGEIVDWLGQRSGDGNPTFDPERGRLRFTDFFTTQTGSAINPQIERIEIDPASGTASGRMLAMLESPFAYGEEVTFAGAVDFIADNAEAQRITAAVEKAIKWVPSYGALRTVGFGRTKSAVVRCSTVAATAQSTPPAADEFAVRWALDRPLCLVGKKHSGNHFESLEVIPGAVLKGAVARLVLELTGVSDKFLDPARPSPVYPKLCASFEAIRFGAARPMEAGAPRRPVEPPLSTVVVPNSNQPYDVALEPGARLSNGVAPEFVSDWKDPGSVRAAFGWPSVPRERRTRTAINEETGRATDELLFSYGLVQPMRGRGGVVQRSFLWESVIGLEEVPPGDRADVRAELAALLAHGLPNIGKTRAIATVEWLAQPTPPAFAPNAPVPGHHVVTLQTDFLLTDPDVLRPFGLAQAYGEYWNEVSEGALKLDRFFAQQSLHGGYLSQRTLRHPYEPFFVTDRGSVFVLKVNDAAKAAGQVTGWARSGLTVPKWVKKRFKVAGVPFWRSCPFLPHAGFGEVMIDLECHHNRLP